MGDLTKNISASELACRCNYEDCPAKLVAHMPLVVAMQDAVDHFKDKYEATKAIINITGPNRCAKHNADEEGTSTGSKHVDCIAADHHIKVWVSECRWLKVPATELALYYDEKYPESHGIGIYNKGRVHLDTWNPGYPRRWPLELWGEIK